MSEEEKKPYWDGRAWVDPRPRVVVPQIAPEVELDFLEEQAANYEADAEKILGERASIEKQLTAVRAQQSALEERAGELAAQSADKLTAANNLKTRAESARSHKTRLRGVLDTLATAQQELVKIQQDAGVPLRERPKEPPATEPVEVPPAAVEVPPGPGEVSPAALEGAPTPPAAEGGAPAGGGAAAEAGKEDKPKDGEPA